MATSKDKKIQQLASLLTDLQGAVGIAFVRYNAITVNEAQEIRRQLRAANMKIVVIKKTLISLALKQAGLPTVTTDDLSGPVAVITSTDDEIAPVQMIKTLKKKYRTVETKEPRLDFAGAIFVSEFINAAAAMVLADTPPKTQSIGAIVSFLHYGPRKIVQFGQHGFQKITYALTQAEKFAAGSA